MCNSGTFLSWSQRFLCVNSCLSRTILLNFCSKNTLKQSRGSKNLLSFCAYRVGIAAGMGYPCRSFTFRVAHKTFSSCLLTFIIKGIMHHVLRLLTCVVQFWLLTVIFFFLSTQDLTKIVIL